VGSRLSRSRQITSGQITAERYTVCPTAPQPFEPCVRDVAARERSEAAPGGQDGDRGGLRWRAAEPDAVLGAAGLELLDEGVALRELLALPADALCARS
jgi:hypothetical protein